MPANKNFENRHLHFLDAISFTGENFTKLNLNIFLRCTGHIFTIEALFRSQHIESSDVFWEFSGCKVCKEVLGAFSRSLRLTTKLFAMKFWYIF